MAAHYFKLVAEKAESIVSSFTEANEAYESGDTDLALIDYMLAAEQGFEIAQTNVAFLLDRARPRSISLPFADLLPLARRKITLITDSALALLYWTRSARQSNIDALVKMGDYYLSGTGIPMDQEKAAACYQAAAETQQSAQALWNLGWMHENGLGGVEQDFHLAKRFYDQAFETNKEAYLAVKLALIKVRMRSMWNSWTHGSVKSIVDEPCKFLPILHTLIAHTNSFPQHPAAHSPCKNGSPTSSKPTPHKHTATPSSPSPRTGTPSGRPARPVVTQTPSSRRTLVMALSRAW
jgi:SEL1 protein